MKKSFLLSAGIIMAFLSLTGCKVRKMDTSDRINIVCTIFPQYDWARNILGDDDNATTLTLLVKNGVDLHSYQPSATDIITLTTCDVLVYVGGESDKWIDEALKNAVNKDMKVINLMEVLKDQIKEEEIIEGMEAEAEEEADEDSEEVEYDEHVWLSIKNAKIICDYFTDTMCQLSPDSAERYKSRNAAYVKKLDAMDTSFRAVAETSPNKTLIFCDRFPFRYLFDDYGLSYYAAFAGCSAETEASFETIAFLSDKLKELKAPAVIVLENSDKKIAKTVIGNAKLPSCDTLTMDSMQAITLRQAFAGVTYISQMQKNLETIQKALK